MSTDRNQQSQSRFTYPGLGMAIGLIVGGLLGLLVDNLAISAGGGMVLGLAIGAALDQRRNG
jgi:F0F1-type ATP synthase assembly protein I